MQKFSTEEERKAFDLGAMYTRRYIMMAIAKYPYSLNIAGAMQLVKNIMNFVSEDTNKIPNNENINFKQFCEKYDYTE